MPEIFPSWDHSDINNLKPFANIKVITVDLDGTLIKTSKPNIWDNILWLTRSLNRSKSKVQIIIATGRTFTGARNTIESLYHKKKLPIILYNGSLVISNNNYEILYKKGIPNSTLELILKELLSFQINVFAYFYIDGSTNLFTHLNSNEYVLGWGNGLQVEYEFNKMPVTWNIKDHHLINEASAILIDISNESKENVLKMVNYLNSLDEIDTTSSGFAYIEIRPKGSDKAKSLKFVADLLGINREDIVAIGDNNNDAEMLQWAGIGIAVSNATEKAIAASNYKSNHDVGSGVLEVLRIIKHSKRYFYNENFI
jgi:Cof subfamily protein (haloacid dehalogenase superfamily)